jgi:hypothetical protein
MRSRIIKWLVFLIMIGALVKTTHEIFRSSEPWLALPVAIVGFILVLYFPYKWFFNTKQK